MAKLTFQVNLENIELSKSQAASLEREINAVVATHLVKAVTAEALIGSKSKLKLNPEWLGIWLRKFNSLEDLKKNTDFKKFQLKAPSV